MSTSRFRTGGAPVRPALRGAFVLVASLLALTGCSHGAAPSQPAHRSLTHAELREQYLRFFRRPESFLAEERLLFNAERRFVEACMDRHGHHARAPLAHSERIIGRLTPDLAFRRKHGYGWVWLYSAKLDEKLPKDKAGRRALARLYAGDESHSIEVKGPVRTIGSGTEGCWGDARRAVYGTIRNSIRAGQLPGDYSWMIGQQVAKDPDYIGAPMRRWSACMAKRGYQYKTLNDPYFNSKNTYDYADPKPTKPPKREIEVAVADGECQIAAGLPQAALKVQTKHVDALPAKDKRDLEEIVVLRQQALKRAAVIVREAKGD